MSISKLVSMLSNSSLTFVQLRLISQRDPFESARSVVDDMVAQAIDENDEYALKIFDFVELPELQLDSPKDKIAFVRNGYGAAQLEEWRERNLDTQFVNCWYVGEYEPAGMWSIYASENDGVAIRSSVTQLRKSLRISEQNIRWGMVEYKDYHAEDTSIDMTSLLPAIYSKRIEYRHENELRLSIWSAEASEKKSVGDPSASGAINADCDLGELIEEVRVAPFAGQWVLEAVEALLFNFQIPARAYQSGLVRSAGY